MNFDQASLLLLLVVPLAAGIAVACMGPQRRDAIRWLCVGASLITLALALLVAGRFMALERISGQGPLSFAPEFVPGSPGVKSIPGAEGPQTDRHATMWNLVPVGTGNIQFYIGVDGINIWMVVLTGVLMLPTVLISWNGITERVNEFYAWLMVLQTAMIGVFLAFDIVLFYVFFELTLVPLFFLIGIWGGAERRYAARKFFIYTLAGGAITLLGVLAVVYLCFQQTGVLTFSIPQLVETVNGALQTESGREFWSPTVQTWVFLALMLGFMIKVPLAPVHTWLPLAHTEAPTAGSVNLAGVLLKIGSYGFLRLCIPLAPDASVAVGIPLITVLAAIGIVHGALCALAQDDMKKMIAYSSVSHLGLCMLGMFALTRTGLTGSLVQMVSHGLSTALLFLVIGMFYDRYHTRKIADYGGMSARLPLLGLVFVFVVLTSVGLPGLNGFVGEVLCLFGIFDLELNVQKTFPILALVGCSGIILGAWYLFTLTRKVLFGPTKEPHHEGHAILDLSGREAVIVIPLAGLCFFLGIHPQPVIRTATPDIERVYHYVDLARKRSEPSALQGRNLPPQELARRAGD